MPMWEFYFSIFSVHELKLFYALIGWHGDETHYKLVLITNLDPPWPLVCLCTVWWSKQAVDNNNNNNNNI